MIPVAARWVAGARRIGPQVGMAVSLSWKQQDCCQEQPPLCSWTLVLHDVWSCCWQSHAHTLGQANTCFTSTML
jgi:hypothetical protein